MFAEVRIREKLSPAELARIRRWTHRHNEYLGDDVLVFLRGHCLEVSLSDDMLAFEPEEVNVDMVRHEGRLAAKRAMLAGRVVFDYDLEVKGK